MFNNQLPGGRGKGWEEKPQVAGFAMQKILPPLPICSYLCDFTECHGAGNRCTQSALMSRHKLLKPAIYQLKLQLKSFIYKRSCILLGGGRFLSCWIRSSGWLMGQLELAKHTVICRAGSLANEPGSPWVLRCCAHNGDDTARESISCKSRRLPQPCPYLCFNGHGQHCPLRYSFAIGRNNLHFSVLQNI